MATSTCPECGQPLLIRDEAPSAVGECLRCGEYFIANRQEASVTPAQRKGPCVDEADPPPRQGWELPVPESEDANEIDPLLELPSLRKPLIIDEAGQRMERMRLAFKFGFGGGMFLVLLSVPLPEEAIEWVGLVVGLFCAGTLIGLLTWFAVGCLIAPGDDVTVLEELEERQSKSHKLAASESETEVGDRSAAGAFLPSIDETIMRGREELPSNGEFRERP